MEQASVLNLDFLRSGRMAAAPASPKLSPRNVEQEPPVTNNVRLDNFYNKTQGAVMEALNGEKVSNDFKIAKCPPSTIVNTDFLRSGMEFKPQAQESSSDDGKSANARLEDFYKATQEAVQRAVQNEAVSQDFRIAKCPPRTIVNTDFLRSGGEFSDASRKGNSADDSHEQSHSTNERLEQFYQRTQAAVENAVKHEAVTADFKHARSEPRTIVNMDYLRSGREFSPSNGSSSGDEDGSSRKRSHSMNERLQDYYNTTQAAVAKAIASDAVTPDFKVAKSTPASIVNVGFLRSGGEFSPQSSPQAVHGAPADASGRVPLAARLEAYHARTAAAAAQAVRSGLSPKN